MKISTSILSSKDRLQCVKNLNYTDTSYIHVDVMDGNFVTDVNFETYEKIHSISLMSKKKLDIHFMVDNPIEYIEKLVNMNIEYISFHLEINKDKKKIIDKIHRMGYKAGIAIKPDTDIQKLVPYLDMIDYILVMSVQPGKGGQTFLEGTVDRLKEIRAIIGDREILIEVDGGININTIDKVKDVDIAVVGSYIVNSNDYGRSIKELLDKFIDNDYSEKRWSFMNLVLCFFAALLLIGFFLIIFYIKDIYGFFH